MLYWSFIALAIVAASGVVISHAKKRVAEKTTKESHFTPWVSHAHDLQNLTLCPKCKSYDLRLEGKNKLRCYECRHTIVLWEDRDPLLDAPSSKQ